MQDDGGFLELFVTVGDAYRPYPVSTYCHWPTSDDMLGRGQYITSRLELDAGRHLWTLFFIYLLQLEWITTHSPFIVMPSLTASSSL